MAADYLKHVREVQPHGPYRLLGWSLEEMLCMQWQRNYKMKGRSRITRYARFLSWSLPTEYGSAY